MHRTSTHLARASAGLLLATFVVAAGAAPPCEALRAATVKLGSVASHQTMSYQRGGSSKVVMEAVVIDKVKWMRTGPGDAWDKETAHSEKGLEELQKADCRYLRDDSADGEPAAVYEVRHLDGDQSNRAEQMWVSKSSGLPLRIVAGDPAGKSSAMTRFDYRNVKAPAP
jgi:outer membrane lipoprotein-sorting protein